MALKKRHKILLAVVAVIVAACSQNDTLKVAIDDSPEVLISFETFHEKSTKTAAATGEISGPANFTRDAYGNGGMGVWGFKGAPDDIPAPSAVSTYTVDVSDEDTFIPVFENTQVWYEDVDDALFRPKGFTYLMPQYWDKQAEYIFFAYAPYNNSKNAADQDLVEFDKTTGCFTVRDIESVQDMSKNNNKTGDALQYGGSGAGHAYQAADATGVTDYLMATYATDQKYSGTNQVGKPGYDPAYTTPEDDYRYQTVGFTFKHLLSKLYINIQADDDLGNDVKSITVDKLTIDNMPETSADVAVYTQTSPTAPAGTYTPANWTGKALHVIDTNPATNTNATSKNKLYVVKGGTAQTAPTTQKQSFYYYIVPNKADNPDTEGVTEKYMLNIKYSVTHLNDATDGFDIDPIDLSEYITEMQQNRTYTLTINIGIAHDMIVFSANVVAEWATAHESNFTVKQ